MIVLYGRKINSEIKICRFQTINFELFMGTYKFFLGTYLEFKSQIIFFLHNILINHFAYNLFMYISLNYIKYSYKISIITSLMK